MNTVIEDFKTGFFGVSIVLKKDDITKLIECLLHLRDDPDVDHFHCIGDYSSTPGVADISFGVQDESIPDNMDIQF